VSAFADLGVDIRCWRDHAYRHDRHTADLLPQYGVTHFSDSVGPVGEIIEKNSVTVVPINTPPDHEHIYHAFRTPEFVVDSDFDGPFGTESREVGAWCDWVLDCAAERVDANTPATILAHPACMKLSDEFEAFQRLCERVSAEWEPVTMSAIEA
jgi:hypothetical protein